MIQPRLHISVAVLLLLGVFATANVHAVPVLQLYVEGSTYDTEHESWVFNATVGEAFTLWVIGNTSASKNGVIKEVKLAAVYPDPVPGDSGSGGSLNISLSPTTTGGFGGFTDSSVPSIPIGPDVISEAGDSPVMSNGASLPSHGVYIPGNEWQQFQLGDMDKTDSPIADFISLLPAPSGLTGQINAYDIVVTANEPSLTGPFDIHFDAYDGILAGNHFKAKFAPFSHDAGTGINHPVPEPATQSLALLVLAGLLLGRHRRFMPVRS